MQERAAGKQKQKGCWSKVGCRQPGWEEGEVGAEMGAGSLCLVFKQRVRSLQ